MTAVLDVVSGVLLVLGCLLGLLAGIGLLRLPDVLSRMHAATKPQVLGVVLVMIGVALRLRDSVDVWMVLLVAAFQVLTAPVAAHLVGRLAYRTRHVRRDLLDVDDLAGRFPSSPPSTSPSSTPPSSTPPSSTPPSSTPHPPRTGHH